MGTIALSSLANSFAPKFSNFPGSGTAAALLPSRPAPQRDASRVQPNQEQTLTDAFERAVYRSLETRQALSLQHTSTQMQLGQGGTADSTAASLETSQLTFDFFQETRMEELSFFQQRTNATGGNLEGPQQASFYAASQEISARFEFSVTISGEALNGFAKTAEGADGSNALMDKLLEVTNKLLGKTDEFLNQFFSQLDGTDGEFNAESLDKLFNEFVSSLLEGLSGDFGAALGLGSPTGQSGKSGTAVQASSVQLEFKFEFSATMTTTTAEAQVQQGDPIVLDLDNDGVELSNYKNGAYFDLLGSGSTQQTAFVNGGDAFLALDRNQDGLINSGQELFGEQHGAKNGFEELRKFDVNGDGVIDRNDAVYSQLKLFKDNGNGITEAGELLSLADAGVDAIELGYKDVNERAAGGNRITQIASYLRNDGSRGQVADALLNYIA
jgi:hypothetical protein